MLTHIITEWTTLTTLKTSEGEEKEFMGVIFKETMVTMPGEMCGNIPSNAACNINITNEITL